MTNDMSLINEIITNPDDIFLLDEDTLQFDSSFLLDANLIPLLKEAKNGCIDAQINLAIAFGDGKGARVNEKLARHFEKMMFDTTDDYRLKLAVLWNPAIREYERGNYERMTEKFHIVIDYMQRYIPMEKWDFSLFTIMENYTQLREE